MEDYRQQAADPHRPVDWRHRLAQQIAAAHRYCGPRDGDPFLRGAVAYHRNHPATGRGRSGSPSPGPELGAAYRLRAASPSVCADLEAQVLAGRKANEIAADLSLSVETVNWYAHLFFDVADRLSATGFIVHNVLPPRPGEAPQASAHRLIAYRLGSSGWEAARGGTRAGDVPGLLRRLALEDSISLQGQLSSALRSGAVRDPQALARLLTAVHQHGADTAADDEGWPARIQAMLQTIPFVMAHTGGEPNVSFPEYDLSAVELNSQELAVLALGDQLPYGELLKQMSFPAPPSTCPSACPEE